MKGFLFATIAVTLVMVGALLYLQQPADKPSLSDIVAGQSEAKKFASYAQLENFIRTNTEAGYYGGVAYRGGAVKAAVMSESSGLSAPQSAQDHSTTNVQVQGVDEADFVKSDGKYLYIVSGNNVVIMDAYPAESAKIVSNITLDKTPSDLYISGNKLVVLGNDYQRYYAMGLSEKMAISGGIRYVPQTQSAFAYVYDVSDHSNPVLKRNVSVDGNYFASRMVGNYVYLVASQPVYLNEGPNPVPLPRIYSAGGVKEVPASDIYYFNVPDSYYVYTNIVSLNTQQDAEDVQSKTFLTGYTQSIFMSVDNLYLAYQKRVGNFYLEDRLLDEVIIPMLPADYQAKARDIQASNISKYEKFDQISVIIREYVDSLSPEQAAAVMKSAEEKAVAIQQEVAKETDKTVVHKIALSNGKIEYKAKGEVSGHVLNQFSMDEYNGNFRIATTTSPSWGWGGPVIMQTAVSSRASETFVSQEAVSSSGSSGQSIAAPAQQESVTPEQAVIRPTPMPPRPAVESQNNVYVLDGNMNTVGKLEDLASGEQIYSVRFMGERAYLVTFKQIDPLFVIDLKDPASPKVLGYLKIPGVSDYLHPYDETHIIGVGRDATEEGRVQGMKLSLFDVSDVANPKEVSKYLIGDRGTYSEALNDHKAFLFSKEKNLLVIPATVTEGDKWDAFQGAYVFSLDLQNGFVLKGKITHRPASVDKGDWYGYDDQIRRSLYMDNVLYTVSAKMVKMNDLGTLAEINKVGLPVEQYTSEIYA